eukprot:4791956-Pyramimonas_sp.AAC.1
MITHFKNTLDRGCALSMPRAVWDAGANFDCEAHAGLTSDVVDSLLHADTEPDYLWQQVLSLSSS